MRQSGRQNMQSHPRGSVMLAVLVIVALLALSAYSFTEIMVTEAEATAMYGRAAQTRMFADSGLEMVAALLGDQSEEALQSTYHVPEAFQNIMIADSGSPRGIGRFSVIAPVESDASSGAIRFGLIDESGRLNLNTLLNRESDNDPDSQVQSREMLMYLPNMTEDIADAILDWIDDDDEQREYGAESDAYLPDYEAKNGPLESLDELLLIIGVTQELLYGEDSNRNGLLDPNENDGILSLPDDDADGLLLLGWSAFLTVYSRESNLRTDGTERINVNHDSLDELYDELEAEFDEDVAKFVVAYRMNGAYQDPADDQSDSGEDNQSDSNADRNSSSNSTNSSLQPVQQLAQGIASAILGSSSGGGAVTRGGMDLSGGGQTQVNSLYDLIGVQVEVEIEETPTLLDSPWTEDGSDLQSYLPLIMDSLSTTDEPYIEGRVNINQTRLEVLYGIPDIPEGVPEAIINSQLIGPNGEPDVDALLQRSTTGWLLMQGIVDLPQIRQLDRYVTAGGDVFRVQVLGYFDEGGPFTRLEAVVDATEYPPKVVFVRDLAELGKGYSNQVLTNGVQ